MAEEAAGRRRVPAPSLAARDEEGRINIERSRGLPVGIERDTAPEHDAQRLLGGVRLARGLLREAM